MRRRRSHPTVALLALLALASLAIPPAAAACSCVAPEDIIDTAGQEPGSAVFTATAGPRLGDDIPVVVTRWLGGIPPVGAVVLRGTAPDDMCGSTTPPPGGEYLFVTYQSATARFNISGCSVQADIASPEGQLLLARAIGRFGPGTALEPDPPPTATPAAQLSVADVLGPIALIVFIGGVLLGVVGAIRRMGVGRD